MSEFTDYLSEIAEDFGPLNARRMFGGYGIYHEGLMIGLVADDVLYLKADLLSEGEFKSRGLGQFEYVKKGKPTRMSYYLAPEEIYEDREVASRWFMMAYEAALRSARER